MNIDHIKAFVPAKNYEHSQQFFTDIGFTATYPSEDLTLLENGSCSLFVFRAEDEDLPKEFMLQICVTDIDVAFEQCSKARHKQDISDVKIEHWGKVFYLSGPSGEFLHITQLGNYKA